TRRGVAQQPLLLNARGLRIALRYDDPAQRGAKFARIVFPNGLPFKIAKHDFCLGARSQKNAPAILRHLHIIKIRTAEWLYRTRGPEINGIHLKVSRTHLLPPLQVIRLPRFQRALQTPILAQIYVVRYLFKLIHHIHFLLTAEYAESTEFHD